MPAIEMREVRFKGTSLGGNALSFDEQLPISLEEGARAALTKPLREAVGALWWASYQVGGGLLAGFDVRKVDSPDEEDSWGFLVTVHLGIMPENQLVMLRKVLTEVGRLAAGWSYEVVLSYQRRIRFEVECVQ